MFPSITGSQRTKEIFLDLTFEIWNFLNITISGTTPLEILSLPDIELYVLIVYYSFYN